MRSLPRLDRVLVKDRIESKPRLQQVAHAVHERWIVSLSKIALRANHDASRKLTQGTALDRVLVKDRIESKPRRGAYVGPHPCRWIVSLSKIALRANHDASE